MQETYTLARPYAVAAFKQAKEQGALDGWSEALRTLGQIASDPDLQKIAQNPKVSREVLAKLVLDIGGVRFFDIARNFVTVLIDADRLMLAPEVSTLFDGMKAEAEDSAQINVLTAFELSEEEQQRLTEALRKHFRRAVNLDVSMDESLIGGVILRAGDKVMDASVRGQLEQLALRLAN